MSIAFDTSELARGSQESGHAPSLPHVAPAQTCCILGFDKWADLDSLLLGKVARLVVPVPCAIALLAAGRDSENVRIDV